MHLSTGMLVYRDLISELAKYLLFLSMSVNLLRSVPEFSMCTSLIVHNNLARSSAILGGGADPMPEIIGLKGCQVSGF